jgi:hypothetical protein
MKRERHSATFGCLLLLIAAAPVFVDCTRNVDGKAKNWTNIYTYLNRGKYRNATIQSLQVAESSAHTAQPTAPLDLTVTTTAIPIVQEVQSYINRSFITTHTTNEFDSSGGDLIVVCASSHAGVTMIPSDNFRNTWISAAGPTNTSAGRNLRTQVWYAKNPNVGPGHIFALSLSAPQPLVVSVLVVRGSNISAPIDAISTIGDDRGSQALYVTSPNITTTKSNDLLIGFAKGSVAETFAPESTFTAQPLASSNFLAAETGPAIVPGTYNARFMLNTASTWEAVVLAVRPSSSVMTGLSWTASTDDIGIAEYSVERCQGMGCRNFAQIATVTDTTFSDIGLATATSYSYRVRARDAAGNLSHYSKVVRLGSLADLPRRMRASSHPHGAHSG